MAPERWQRIKELFASALECAPTERSGFLDEACARDDALRREIERLLVSYEEEPNFMEISAGNKLVG
jgi:hypothetical protein